jgi:radical SAM protein with 4Fe4S-binding SPASM domain
MTVSVDEALTSGAPRLENITISLSLSCNQSCKHCWVSAGEATADEITDDEIRSILRQARELGAVHVKFTGGEPLLRPGLVDLLQFAYTLGMRISLETNGTALTDNSLIRLQPLFDRLHFYVSLDGACADTHDAFRGQRGAFRRTTANLRRTRDRGGYFTIHTVVRRGNHEEVPAVLALAQDLGASQLKLILSIHDLGRGTDVQDDALAPADVFALLDRLPPQRLWDYTWSPARTRETLLMTTLPPAFQPSGESATCGWSKSFLAVLANGEVALCHGMYELDEAKAGNIRQRSLADLWLRSALFTETRAWTAEDLSGICGNCAVAVTCRGLCRASAIAKFRDLRAPYPLCQTMYEAGYFPPAMVRDSARDSRYSVEAAGATTGAPTAAVGRAALLPLTVLPSRNARGEVR